MQDSHRLKSAALAAGLLLGSCAWALQGHAAPPLQAYGQLPSVDLVRLSPSGARYAYVALAGQHRKLVVARSDGMRVLSTGFGNAKIRDIEWAGDRHVLVTTSSTLPARGASGDPVERASVIDIRLDQPSSRIIFNRAPEVARSVFGYYGEAQVDRRIFGYFAGISLERSFSGGYYAAHRYPDLYRVNLDTGEVSRKAKGSDEDHHWVIARDGSIIAHSEYSDGDGRWRLYAGAGHDRLLFSKTAPDDNIYLLGQGRTADSVLVADKSGAVDVAAQVFIKTGKGQRLFDGISTFGYLFDRDDGRLIGARTGKLPGAYFFNPQLQARYVNARRAFAPDRQLDLTAYSRDMQRVILETDDGGDSGTYWMANANSGSARRIGRRYPDIDPADVGPVSKIKYKAADGTSIEAILTLPPGRKPQHLALVVMPHGGPIGTRSNVGFNWWAQAFASRGYAVLQPNYRGSSGYGRPFRQAGLGQWGGKILSDISAGIRPLAARGIVDAKRVCIVGASYGGYAALAGVTLQQGLYRCAVSVGGVSDLPALYRRDSSEHVDPKSTMRYLSAATGIDQNGEKILQRISPLNYAKRADAPILLIHGSDDTDVLVSQSEDMAAALKQAGKAVELVVLKDEDHYLSRQRSRITMVEDSVHFVERYNPAN